jgi:hypothetical protein
LYGLSLKTAIKVDLCVAIQRHAFDRRHCGLARHFKTDPTETVALCFGYAKTPC